MKTPVKLKPSEMTPEVRRLLDLRHGAEQRGYFEILGRLITLETAHGLIEFPAEHGEWAGPDLACSMLPTIGGLPKESDDVVYRPPDGEWNTLLVLGEWRGLPGLRRTLKTPHLDARGKPVFTGEDGKAVAANTPGAVQVFDQVGCPRCARSCDVCKGVGRKQCEGLDCGGRGYIEGLWLSCPGPGCHKDTGHFKPGCATCSTSPVQGQVREHITCGMCAGTGQMVCSGCRGTKKRSTGHVNGSLDYRLPACKACGGTGWKGEWVPQDLEKFTNAVLRKPAPRLKSALVYLVLGPIVSFTIQDFSTSRLRLFEVSPDADKLLLNLLVPASARQKPQKAYLVGGVVREHGAREGAA